MIARTFHNLTLLPDGKVLCSGGMGSTSSTANPDPKYTPQIWDSTGAWTASSGASALADEPAMRGYHSVALLLPDGRVLASSGNADNLASQAWTDAHRMTIFCPPYLFNANGTPAAQPPISSARDTVTFGSRISICMPNADSARAVAKVALMRPGSVTHAFNTDQRYLPLVISEKIGNMVVAQAPADSNLAPPGS